MEQYAQYWHLIHPQNRHMLFRIPMFHLFRIVCRSFGHCELALYRPNIRPESHTSITPPFNDQDQRIVVYFHLSIAPLTPLTVVQDTYSVISGASEVSPYSSGVHHSGNEIVQDHERSCCQPEGAHPIISPDSDAHQYTVVAFEEHRQELQRALTESPKGNYDQHGRGTEEISARSDANALSDKINSLSEQAPQPSMSRGNREVFNNQEACLEKSSESLRSHWKTPDTPSGSSSPLPATHDANVFSDTNNASSEGSPQLSMSRGDEEGLHKQGTFLDRPEKSTLVLPSQIALPSELPVTRFPLQNSIFQNAQKVDIGGNARFMNIARDNVSVTNNWNDKTHGLEEMKPFVSFSAQFDSSAQDPERVCHQGTRQNVLKQIHNWIDNPNSTERIFWLHGPAGAGKSAIAQTIAHAYDRPNVAATFFFYRSDPSRNDGNRLFTTLSYQLAFSIPAIKDHIIYSLHQRPDLPTKGIEKQFEHLIARPFLSLIEAASQQSYPVEFQQLAPVITIDGVDECADEKLQQRFLKVIGNAVKDRSFPFRFLICSRPEAHIEDALNQFKTCIVSTDLAKLDDANRDIEKYLVDEFSRIASNRGLKPTWPGQEVIQDIIYKSSGNFIFASLVIKFVSDEDSVPEDQLDIVLNLKPPERMSPFAALDELYLEILRRQPYQDFVKTFLALLVGRTALPNRNPVGDENLHEDDATLMNVSERELHTKLRRMRSLLKFEPYIDVHHKSFLDFLSEWSRSGDYCVSERAGTRRYVELVVDSIDRYTSRLIENLDSRNTHHLSLNFINIVYPYPPKIDLPIEESQDIAEPLIQILDQVLKLANSSIANELLFCDKCNIFDIIRDLLLHLAMRRCIDVAHNEVAEQVTPGKSTTLIPSVQTESIESAFENDLDSSLSALFTQLQETKLELPLNAAIINQTCSVLQFDSAEIAMKVRSISDAQRLVDLLVLLIDEKYTLNQYNAMSNAVRLVLNIFVRVPVLPQSLFLNVQRITSGESPITAGGIKVNSQAALMWRVLDRNYIHLEMDLQEHSLIFLSNTYMRCEKWRQVLPLDSTTVIELVLEVAKAIQYLDLMGALPGDRFHIGDVYPDLSLCQRVKIGPEWFHLIIRFKKSTNRQSLYEDSVFGFGCFFYEAYFNVKIDFWGLIEEKRRIVVERPSSPQISENAWELIQRCCAEDPKNRPTFDKVVKEMEMWRNQSK